MDNVNIIPAPYKITADDKRGLVVVIVGITLSFVLACLLIRIYVRVNVKEWKRDDSLLAVATFFCCLQAATVLIQVQEGLGLKHLDQSRLHRLGKANFAQQILYTFTLFLSKCVVILLFLRLTASRKHITAAYATLGLCGLWFALSIVLVSIHCNPFEFITRGTEYCGDLSWRWVIIGVTDIITEIVIFANAIYLVAGLHMSFRLKAVVVGAFSIRLPVIIASALRVYYIRQLPHAKNTAFAAAFSIVAGQFQLDMAIMASTISCMGPFLRPFDKELTSSYQNRYAYPSIRSGQSHNHSHNDGRHRASYMHGGNTIKMRPVGGGAAGVTTMTTVSGGGGTLKHKHTRNSSGAFFSTMATADFDDRGLRPDFFENEAGAARSSTVSGGADLDQLSLESNDSRKMIIAKKTVINIERDDERSFGADHTSKGSGGSGGGFGAGPAGGVGFAYSRN